MDGKARGMVGLVRYVSCSTQSGTSFSLDDSACQQLTRLSLRAVYEQPTR